MQVGRMRKSDFGQNQHENFGRGQGRARDPGAAPGVHCRCMQMCQNMPDAPIVRDQRERYSLSILLPRRIGSSGELQLRYIMNGLRMLHREATLHLSRPAVPADRHFDTEIHSSSPHLHDAARRRARAAGCGCRTRACPAHQVQGHAQEVGLLPLLRESRPRGCAACCDGGKRNATQRSRVCVPIPDRRRECSCRSNTVSLTVDVPSFAFADSGGAARRRPRRCGREWQVRWPR
jgi:hypothetical protein